MTKVLFIAGVPHSGSTIVSQILDGVDGFVAVGESYYLWDAYEQRFPCGCGQPLRECEWWRAIFASAFPHGDAGVAALKPDRYYMALQELPALALRKRAVPPLYQEALERTLHAVAATSGARVIVEASKSPTYGQILDKTRGVDLYVVHLVRSPQAIASSWSRFDGEAGRPVRHAMLWNAWNATIELLWARRRGRYLRVRYEDFAAQPQRTIAAIAEFGGEKPMSLPFASEHTARLAVAHTVAGNPVRFRTGDVPIRVDERWREEYPAHDRRTLEALTWPLRARYGY